MILHFSLCACVGKREKERQIWRGSKEGETHVSSQSLMLEMLHSAFDMHMNLTTKFTSWPTTNN
jgi:hypothetical protein